MTDDVIGQADIAIGLLREGKVPSAVNLEGVLSDLLARIETLDGIIDALRETIRGLRDELNDANATLEEYPPHDGVTRYHP